MGRRKSEDEPTPEGEEWVEWGGELIWAAGFTSGGAPYGITADEFRRANEDRHSQKGWVRAKRLLEQAFQNQKGSIDIVWVKKIGEGLSRDIFAAHVDLSPDTQGYSGSYAVLLPRPDVDPQIDERTRREAALLEHLAGRTLPFRVPRLIGVLPESGRSVLVRSFLQGVELDLRAGRQAKIRPWAIVWEIAAAIHRIDNARMMDILPGHETRLAHAEAELAVFEGLKRPEMEEAHAWALDHLPQNAPSALLHGDLLGQNILLSPDELPGVIDWKYCRRGDSAYDLAIITRGHKQPFQIVGGMERLIEAYVASGGIPLTPSDVHFYEITMAARWYRNALSGKHFEPVAQAIERLGRIVRRAMTSGT